MTNPEGELVDLLWKLKQALEGAPGQFVALHVDLVDQLRRAGAEVLDQIEQINTQLAAVRQQLDVAEAALADPITA